MSNTETTETTETIVAEVTTVEMPEGRANVELWRVPNDRLDDTTVEWERIPGAWVDSETVTVEDGGLTVEEVEEIVGRMLGGDEVSMDLVDDDGGTQCYQGRVLA